MNSKKVVAAAALVGSAVVFLIASSSFGPHRPTEPEAASSIRNRSASRPPHMRRGRGRGQGSQGPVSGVRRHGHRPGRPGRIQLHVSQAHAAGDRRLRRIAQAANAGSIVIADSTPFKKGRSWSIGVKNLSDQPREFFVGVVCVG